MIIGNKEKLAFDFKKLSEAEHICSLKVYVRGKNICKWKDVNDPKWKTVTWNIDGLIRYLYGTIDFIYHDLPFPFAVDGECAAELDNNARDFESDNDSEIDEYYDKLNEWSYKHSWMHARDGAIVPDVMFRKVEDNIEISWWSDQEDEGRLFQNRYGFILIPCNEYESLITELFNQYNNVWK